MFFPDLAEDLPGLREQRKDRTHYTAFGEQKSKRVESRTSVLELYALVSLTSDRSKRRAIGINRVYTWSKGAGSQTTFGWYTLSHKANTLKLGRGFGYYYYNGHMSDVVFMTGKEDVFVLFDPEIGGFLKHASAIPSGGSKTYEGKDRTGRRLKIVVSRGKQFDEEN